MIDKKKKKKVKIYKLFQLVNKQQKEIHQLKMIIEDMHLGQRMDFLINKEEK